MREYTPAARLVALVLSLAVLHPKGALAQVNVSSSGGTFNGGSVTGATTFLDGTNFSINNTADLTKQIQFSAASITTGTARTYTMPNVSATVAVLSAQTFPGIQTFSSEILISAGGELFFGGDGGTYNSISMLTAGTPDQTGLWTGNLSNSWHLAELGDRTFDFAGVPCGGAACTDPVFVAHSSVQDLTQYNAHAVWGFARKSVKTLTESSATSTVQIPVAASTATGGTFHYCVFAADATDQQQRCGRIKFSASNKAATETCGLNTDAAVTNDASITELEDGNAASISAGTLTYAITCSTAPTNAVDIQINAVSSLTQTTLEARWSVDLIGPGQPARQ